MSTVNIVAGNTYTFENLETGKFLNLYAGNTTNGTNVCQYDEDGSDEQKWTFRSDDKLYTNTSTTKCLDKYTVSGDAKNRNADLWTNNDDANQKVEFITTNTDYVRIHLLGTSYYLAASAGSSNGANTAARKEPGAAGNVFWATYALADGEIESLDQFKWIARLDGEDVSGGEDNGDEDDDTTNGQKLIHPFATQYYSAGYEDEAPAYTAKYKYKHHAVDMFGSGSYATVIRASGDGEVVGTKEFNSLGKVLAVRYDNVLDREGNNIGSIIVRYCHLASWAKTSGPVEKGEIIATEGSTGNGAYNSETGNRVVHLHLEIDTDTDYPLMTPTEGGGINTTLNPLDVLYKSSSQVVEPDCNISSYYEEEDSAGRAWYDKSKIEGTPTA